MNLTKVLLRVSPMRGLMHFGNRGKPSPKYIGAFEILARVREVAYKLDLPNELEKVHHVKYPAHILTPEVIELDESLTYTRSGPPRSFSAPSGI